MNTYTPGTVLVVLILLALSVVGAISCVTWLTPSPVAKALAIVMWVLLLLCVRRKQDG